MQAEFRAPRRRTRVREDYEAPLPVPVQRNRYRAELINQHVVVRHPDHIQRIHDQGYFGKGVLSRARPEHSVSDQWERHQDQMLPVLSRPRYEELLRWAAATLSAQGLDEEAVNQTLLRLTQPIEREEAAGAEPGPEGGVSVKAKRRSLWSHVQPEAKRSCRPDPEDQDPDPSSDQDPDPSSDQDPDPSSDQDPDPSSDQNPDPSKDQNPDPSSDQDPDPSSDQNPDPSKDLNPDPSSDLNPDPSSDLNPDPSSDQNPDPSKDQNPDPSSDQNPDPSSDLDSDSSRDPGSDPDSDPDSDSDPGPLVPGPGFVLVVSDSEAGGGVRELRPTPFFLSEYLQLSLEEAFFLVYALGCLSVYLHQEPLSVIQLWRKFRSLRPDFVSSYAAYHHYRSRGWVPKTGGGAKYGADLMLYRKGPPFYHASYSVVIERADGAFRDSTLRPFSWRSLAALSRITANVSKELMLCYVIHPVDQSEAELDSPVCLRRLRVQEVIVSRWVSTREREQEDI